MNRIALALTIMLLLLPTVQAADIETSGSCSLADAITAANTDEAAGECPAGDGADIISLSGDITLTAALPQITSEITIEGNNYTISGNNRFRIFVVNGGTFTVNNLAMIKGNGDDWGGAIVNVNNGTLTINNSSITSSRAAEGGAIGNSGMTNINNSTFSNNSADYGGVIHNVDGTLTSINNTMNNNRAKGGGGTIYNKDAELIVTESTFSNNVSGDIIGGGGGAILNLSGGVVTIIDSTFNHNSSEYDGGSIVNRSGSITISTTSINDNSAEVGGAIFNWGTLSLSDSIISNNAADSGGAIFNNDRLNIVNSNISNNSAKEIGGAIRNNDELNIINSIIHANSASNGGGLYVQYWTNTTLTNVTLTENSAGKGGGIHKEVDAFLNLQNTIIAGSKGGDCFGRLDENISNLIADGSCFAILSGDPMLGELVEPDDGSPAYFPLLGGSPAIDAADDEYCPDTDMLGAARPQGAACDIGAYERPQ